MPILHPDTGLHYVHVFENGPIYDEATRAWVRTGPWTQTMRSDVWAARKREFLSLPTAAITFWGSTPEAPPNRRCLIAAYYTEAVPIEPGAVLIREQRAMLNRLLALADGCDFVFGHSPTSVEGLKKLVKRPVELLPSGYDPEAFGRPDFNAPKSREIVWYGFSTPRREQAWNALNGTALKGRIARENLWGAERRKLLNASKANLILLHANGIAYPTMRIWATIGTSAAIVTEKGDTWPAVGGKHTVEIPIFDGAPDWGSRAAKILLPLLDSGLLELAKRAHAELSAWTPERIMKEYLIPAFERARIARGTALK